MTLSMAWLLPAGLALLLLGLWMLVAPIGPILRLRIHPGRVEIMDVADIPGDYDLIRQRVEPKLAALGFAFSHAHTRHATFGEDPVPHHVWVYHHPASHAFAALAPTTLPGRAGPPYQLEFISIGAHGRVLSTVNAFAHQLLPVLAEFRLVDAMSADLAGHWQAHREALRDWDDTPVAVNPEAFIAHERDFLARYQEALHQQGWLVADRAGRLRFRLLPALRFARRIVRGEQRAARVLAGAEDHDMPVPLEAEIDAFRRQQAQQGSGGWLGRTALFVLSVALFAYSFGLRFSWDFVAILMAVLLFHELGHLAGMWWFGYRELRILFIPFLGAVAMGQDQQARPGERIVVSLLGPMPGLLLGLTLLGWLDADNHSWLMPWVVMLLLLNYLNLLPLLPLDGGQVVNTALLGRMPRLQLLFLGLSALLAGLGAWFLGDPVLWILAGFLLLGTLGMRSRLALRRSLRARFPDAHRLPGETLLRGIFQHLREGEHAALPLARRAALVQELIRWLGEEPPSRRVMWLGLGGYGACLLLPVVWLWISLVGVSPAVMLAGGAPPDDPDFTARLADTTDPAGRFAIHMEAGEWYEGVELYPLAQEHYREARTLAGTVFEQDDPRQARVREALAWMSEPGAALQHLQAALAIRQQHPEAPLALADTRLQLADSHRRLDDPAGAARQYRQLAALVETHPETPGLLSRLTPAVDFFMDRGNYARARELLLLQHRQPREASGEWSGHHREVLSGLGWAALLEDDPEAARTWFEQALALPATDDDWADLARWERLPVLLDLMVLHGESGDAARARDHLGQAREILEDTGWMSLGQYLEGAVVGEMDGWRTRRRQRWRRVAAGL